MSFSGMELGEMGRESTGKGSVSQSAPGASASSALEPDVSLAASLALPQDPSVRGVELHTVASHRFPGFWRCP